MEDDDKALQAYYEKMLRKQYDISDEIPTQEELKKIALEIGVSEEEWQKTQDEFQEKLKGGKFLISQNNFSDAISQLEEAASINPYHIEVVYSLAYAYFLSWKEKGGAGKAKAEELLQRAMRIQPSHGPSLRLRSEIIESTVGKKQKSNSLLRNIVLGLSGLAILFSLTFAFTYNSVSNEAKKVSIAQVQLLNVYEREINLIPKLVNYMISLKELKQEEVERLNRLNSEINQIYQSLSEKEDPDGLSRLDQKINELIAYINLIAKDKKSFRESKEFSNLQTDIKGSENRISVEKKKYLTQLIEYNTFVKSFPVNIFGFQEKNKLQN